MPPGRDGADAETAKPSQRLPKSGLRPEHRFPGGNGRSCKFEVTPAGKAIPYPPHELEPSAEPAI